MRLLMQMLISTLMSKGDNCSNPLFILFASLGRSFLLSPVHFKAYGRILAHSVLTCQASILNT